MPQTRPQGRRIIVLFLVSGVINAVAGASWSLFVLLELIAPSSDLIFEHIVYYGAGPFLLLNAVLLLLHARRLERLRRGLHQLCPLCCYDRRGLEPGAACPECGSAPE